MLYISRDEFGSWWLRHGGKIRRNAPSMHGITNPESIAGSFPSRDALRTAPLSLVRGQRHQRGWMAIRRRPVAKKRTESDRISRDLGTVLVWMLLGVNTWPARHFLRALRDIENCIVALSARGDP